MLLSLAGLGQTPEASITCTAGRDCEDIQSIHILHVKNCFSTVFSAFSVCHSCRCQTAFKLPMNSGSYFTWHGPTCCWAAAAAASACASSSSGSKVVACPCAEASAGCCADAKTCVASSRSFCFTFRKSSCFSFLHLWMTYSLRETTLDS